MDKNSVTIEANSNFHTVAGKSLFESDDERFVEYRRKWREYPRDFHVAPFPLFLDIEVTSACNLKCPFCATTYLGNSMKKGFIEEELVKKIIDEGAKEGLCGVKFNIRGEPLLHKQIDKFVRYAKDAGFVDVYFNTNALLLDESMAVRLINAGLDRISISAEGYTKGVYEKYRVGSNFETVLQNITNLQKIKKEMGVSHPKVRVQTVLLDEIKETLFEYKDFWSAVADEVAYLDFRDKGGVEKDIVCDWACPQLWQRMAVFFDGTILPCNFDTEGYFNLGNAKNISIKDAWHSDKNNGYRKLHQCGNSHKIKACNECYFRQSEIIKLQEAPK
jgi:radical SAM protein with 4Fe4S-binding SPASM domain